MPNSCGVCHIALGIASSLGTRNLFGTCWSQNGGQDNLLLLGVSSFGWSIWLSRNDVVFEKKKTFKIFFAGSFKGNSLVSPMGQVLAK
jgi:hypothetical protein